MTDRDNDFDPYQSDSATKLREEAHVRAYWLGEAHYPHAVITDRTELWQLAERICKAWWNELEKSGRAIDFDEVKRVYASAFVASYIKGVEAATPYEQKETRKKALAQTSSATITIKNVRYYDDRAVYELELRDGLYLETPDKSTAFEVHFSSNGDILQSEFSAG